MKLKIYFLLLAIAIALIAGVALFATFHSHPVLFYVTEGYVVLLLLYLIYFYHKTIRPYDTLISGMELVRDLDLTTRLAPSGQYETDIIVRTFNDLLSRLRSEHLTLEEQYTFLNLLIEASPMGVVQCDLEGHITTMNPAAREMLTPTVETALRTLPLGSETTLRLGSTPQIYRLSHLSFPDRGYQHPFYLIESLTSEVRSAEKAAYERVIRMIAHEVNNSVTGIVGLMEGAHTVTEGAATERLLAMSDFVTRFANVVKIPEPHLQLCDLSEEVEACRPFLESLCNSAQVHLDFHLTDEATPVRLDTALFQQVLINIVKNSIESITVAPHTAPEGATILLTVAIKGAVSLSGDERGATLTITDNGRGISDEAAQQLFTPFFSTKPQGQGLGLLLVRDILTAHQCSFTLRTDPADHLTRFTIQFP
ncbi:MAG: PAS domain-containing sensor histidine kinase [Bacteroidaceae bacterium]|nr:PAS domain-containing sensor histidine kinase [Bacteroidaceae bacterium]